MHFDRAFVLRRVVDRIKASHHCDVSAAVASGGGAVNGTAGGNISALPCAHNSTVRHSDSDSVRAKLSSFFPFVVVVVVVIIDDFRPKLELRCLEPLPFR